MKKTTATVLVIALILSRCFDGVSNFDKWQEEHFGKIQFKGKIIKMTEFTRNGRYYDIACVKLDYSNVDSFYAFVPNYSFLKIAHGKAVMPLNSGEAIQGQDLKVDYVEVNMNNNGKEVYYHNGKVWYEQKLALGGSPGLVEADLKFCDE